MLSFNFTRNLHRAVPETAVGKREGESSGFVDSKPASPLPDTRGWFDSSADLKGGLQIQEDDFDSLPLEERVMMATLMESQPGRG
ncbi:MAG: hypothetical protein K2X42_11425 [Burkholderiaceae bacterium]|nr:hypothetical protein [Burkholderiaceae bacterium]